MKSVPCLVASVAVACIAFHAAGKPELSTFGIGAAQVRISTAICFIAAAYIAVRTQARMVGTLRQQMALGIAINGIVLMMVMAVVGQLWPHIGVTMGTRPNALTILSMMTIAVKGVLIVNGNNNRMVILIAMANLAALALAAAAKLAGHEWINSVETGMSYTTLVLLSLLFVSDIHGRRWGSKHVCVVKGTP